MEVEGNNLSSVPSVELIEELAQRLGIYDNNQVDETAEPVEERKLPEGKRAVRTKSSGDRVFVLDEEKKTRQWVTNPEVLKGIGFEATDVVEITDEELGKYQMASAIYKLDEPA
jgi:hypothetical protein